MTLWSIAAIAAAQTVPTIAGIEVSVPPCSPEAAASCWDDTPRFQRFAPAEGLVGPSLASDVRVAHHEGQLLVRARGLPEGHRIVVVVTGPDDDLGRSTRATGSEWVSLEAPYPLRPGSRHHLRLSVEPAEGLPTLPRYWSPSGAGEPWRPIALWVASEARDGEIRVTRDGQDLVADAPGADEVTVSMVKVPPRRKERYAYDAFTRSGPPPLRVPAPPETGTYDVTARWGTENVQSRRFWWDAPVPEALSEHGIHPAPKQLEVLGRNRFTLRSSSRIHLGDEAHRDAAELLARELQRITGLELPVRVGERPQRGDVWVGPPESRPEHVDVAWPGPEGASDGFQLRIAEAAWVTGRSARGSVYGVAALADALGEDRSSPWLEVADWPESEIRFLFHRIDGSRDVIPPARYVRFLEHMATRGRYNLLVLSLRGAYRYESHPELARRNAWTREQLEEVLTGARRLGLEVVPGINSPAHADWLLTSHPELREDRNTGLACTRHPELRPLMADLYAELIEVFDQPRWVHVGFDETFWSTDRKWFGPERCPRCSGTPRSTLFADYLGWTLDTLDANGAGALAWADMVVEKWNGRYEGVHEALGELEPRHREQVTWLAWSPLGDPVRTLHEQGNPVWWGMTGTTDTKRSYLTELPEGVDGAGLALFAPFPWSASPGVGSDLRAAKYHWSLTVLAGAMAWRHDLATVPQSAILPNTRDLLAYRPGLQAVVGKRRELELEGSTAPAWLAPGSFAASRGTPLTLSLKGTVRGLELDQATWLSHQAGILVARQARRAGGFGGVVARLRVRFEDGESVDVPLVFGVDTWHPQTRHELVSLWGAASTLDQGEDGARYRFVWHNPRPEVPVVSAVVETDVDGAWVLIDAVRAVK